MTRVLTILTAAAALALSLAVTAPAGAPSSNPEFIKALHAWAPATRQHTNTSEIAEGKSICRNLKLVANNRVPGINGENDAAVGHPRGTTAVEEVWSALLNNSDQLFTSTVTQGLPFQAAVTLDADLFGVSVLKLCPHFETAAKYANQHNLIGSAGKLPTTSTVPEWAIRATTNGYAYSLVRPTPTSTTVPPQPLKALPTPFPPAPAALAQVMNDLDSNDSFGGPPTDLSDTAYIDPNNPSWAFFSIGPAPGFEDQIQGGAGIAQLVNGAWQVVDGPASSDLECATDLPTNIRTDFGFGATIPSYCSG
jgi:hypothetical protein